MKVSFDTKKGNIDWSIIDAIRAGKMVQFWDGVGWQDYNNPLAHIDFDLTPPAHRIKPPAPQFRPWTAEEFPMPCVVRSKECPTSRWTVLSVSKHGVGTSDCTGIRNDIGVTTFELLFRHNEHSTDGCKTWSICGVQINGEVAL